MRTKLIVIEGLDGCGKTTQIELLKKDFPYCKFITFPNYNSNSGKIIKSYLEGGFPEQNNRVNVYSASCFYAVDRYTSFKTSWEFDYLAKNPIVSARYVSSNAIFQMTKLDKSDWQNYLDWLYDLEYCKLGLPRPTDMIFLNVPVEYTRKLLMHRYQGNLKSLDILERDADFAQKCYDTAHFLAEKENWHILECVSNGELRSIESIHTELTDILKEALE